MTDVEQPEVGQDPESQEVAAPAATPATPVAGNGPWADDLALLFQDEATRSQVDAFLRTKVQPYTTKLEQDLSQQREAAKLYNDFNEDPNQTFVNVVQELYGPEAAQAAVDAINAQLQAGEQAQQEQQQAYQQVAQQLPPEVLEMLAEREQAKAEAEYNAAMDAFLAEPGHEDLSAERLHVWVMAADGDFEQAAELYRAYVADLAAGRIEDTVGQAQAAENAAPPVTGSDTQTAQPSTTPAVRKQTLDEAIEEFARGIKAQEAPPVVG